MDIKRGNTTIATIHPNDDAWFSWQHMRENVVKLNFRVPVAIDLQIGDKITWQNRIYKLKGTPVVKEVSTREVEYNCEFKGLEFDLPDSGYKLFDNTETLVQSEFSLTGSALDFVRLLVDNLNRNGEGWTVGTVVDSESKTLDFSGEDCLAVIQRLATEFNTEWFIVETKSVNLCKKTWVQEVIALSYGMGGGLKWLRRQSRDSEPIITRLYAYGSARNLPSGYRGGASRLMLNEPGYLSQNEDLYGIREGYKTFEEVYPRLAAGGDNDPGTVTAVDGILKFTDTNIDFDVNDTLSTDPAKVKFNSGELAGYEFEIESFDNATKTFKIIVAEADGITLPVVGFSAAIGDKYVLLNIKMPDAYVWRAQLELDEKAGAWLADYSSAREAFSGDSDTLEFKRSNILLSTCQVVRIQSSVLGIDREIRILGWSQNLNQPYQYQNIEFAEKVAIGTLDKLSNVVSNTAATVAIAQKLNWQTTLQLIQMINGASNPTDFSNITGLPTDNDALAKYLNAYPDAKSEILSGAIVWDHDLTYQATEIQYKILGIPYTSMAQEITLEAAHPTLSRIDTFYVDMFGNLNVATGTPAENPTSAILNSIQLEVMTVLIGPGATEPSDLNVAKVYDEGAEGEWTRSETHDAYVSAEFNNADAPRIGSNRIKVGINVPDTVVAAPLHFLGEKYGGGIIFYIDETSAGKKGLICAENDTALDVFYSNLSGSSGYTTGATDAARGSGQANTTLMLANDAAKDDAAKFCDDLDVDDFTDWYLGSEGDMAQMYFNRFKIGNLNSKTYWSSTETAWNKARCISFANGVAYTRDKNNRYAVRAVRSFDDNSLTNNKPVATLTPVNTKLTFSTDTPLLAANGILSLFVKSSMAWKVNTMLLIESYLGATKTGSVVVSPSVASYGYKSENPDWQLVAIQMANFSFSRDTLDCFKISLVGSWTNKIDFGIDVIRYQYSKIDIKKDGTQETGIRFVETPDGILTDFSLPKPYKPGTTKVYCMGMRQYINIDYSEIDGIIRFFVTPLTGEILTCDYYSL